MARPFVMLMNAVQAGIWFVLAGFAMGKDGKDAIFWGILLGILNLMTLIAQVID